MALAALAREVLALLELRRRQGHERELRRLSRLYAALSQINHVIIQTRDTAELSEKVCRALVEQGGFHVAWIGWHDQESGRVTPVARYGDDSGFLDDVEVYDESAAKTGDKRFRADRSFICNDLLSDPAARVWRSELAERGFRSMAAFPITFRGEVRATLCVHADQPDVFHENEIALLEEAARDLGFGLEMLEKGAEHERAAAQAENERLFSDTMIDSMPGILYFYDGTGRFLRWNRNFETVSGYSAAEIAMMHPLDFFDGNDARLVEERINEVFKTGEASVEAHFLAKGGARTPYFFTGRHVLYNGRNCLVGVGIDMSRYKPAGQAPRGAG
jgi:PAS domain S-box-containing protein